MPICSISFTNLYYYWFADLKSRFRSFSFYLRPNFSFSQLSIIKLKFWLYIRFLLCFLAGGLFLYYSAFSISCGCNLEGLTSTSILEIGGNYKIHYYFLIDFLILKILIFVLISPYHTTMVPWSIWELLSKLKTYSGPWPSSNVIFVSTASVKQF